MAGTSIMLHHFAYKLSIVIIGCFILYLIEQNINKNKKRLSNQNIHEVQCNDTDL
jgi:hypothetical protein